MLTYSTIAAGEPATASAMTNHLLTQTLPREVADLARYYTRGMDAAGSAEDRAVTELAEAVDKGGLSYSEAVSDLMHRHADRGADFDMEEARLGERLALAVEQRDFEAAYGQPVAEPRRDMHPLVAGGLGLDPDRGVTRDEINALLAGRRADGARIEGKQYAAHRTVTDRRTGAAKEIAPIGSVDFCLTPDKSVSVAWAFALPAEQASIYVAHRDAAAEAMAAIEARIGQARYGKGGRDGADPGHVALIGAYMLPGTLVALPSGWFAARLGERRMVLAGLALSTAGGLAFAMAPSFGSALAARLASGAGAALLNVVLSAMVMARFTGPALAPAVGGFLAAYPFGIGLTLVSLPVLAAALSWRAAMLAVAAGCALALVAVPFVLARRRPGPAPTTEPRPVGTERRGGPLQPGEWGPVLAAGAAWAGMNAGYAVLLGFAPALLAGRGASPEAAGALASLAGWATIPLAPLGGALAERTGRPLLATAGSLAATALAVLALATGVGPQSGALLAAGLVASIAATVIMTLPARALAPESRAFGMGVYWTIFYVGMAALPPVAGWAADATGSAAAALGVAAAFLTAAALAVAVYGALLGRQRSGESSTPGATGGAQP